MTNRALQPLAAACAATALVGLVGLTAPAGAQSPQQTAIISELSVRVDRLEELVRRLNGEIEELRHQMGAPATAAAAPPPSPPPPTPTRAAAPPPPAPRAAAPPPAPPGATAAVAAPAPTGDTLGRMLTAREPAPAEREATGAPRSLLPPVVGSAMRRREAPPPATAAVPAREPAPAPAEVLRGPQTAELLPPRPTPAPAVAPPPAAASEAAPGAAPTGQLAAVQTAPGAQAAYDDAYGLVLNGDNAGAEGAFSDFLERFPHHPLAGNAQYWLAETYFARGDYRRAAQGFLKGYKTYGDSDKAPDSLLKLGMSLAQLGEKVQACASLGEIAQKFADARAAVRERAAEERDRLGC